MKDKQLSTDIIMANIRPISYTIKLKEDGSIESKELKGLEILKRTPIDNIATKPRKTLKHTTFDSDIGICIKDEKEEPSVKSCIVSD